MPSEHLLPIPPVVADRVPSAWPARRAADRVWGLALLLTCGLHVALGVWFHYDRAWQGDEWGSVLALGSSYRALLTGFGEWRTMNFYLAGLKALRDGLGGSNWLLVLPGMICGVWLVWLTGGIARRLGSGQAGALAAALLVAVNPFLVSHSVTIRAYIFLAALSAAVLLFLLDWREHGRWRDGVLCGLMAGLALLAHLNGVYSVAAAAVLALGWTIQRAARRGRDGAWLIALVRLAVPMALAAGLAMLAYLPQLPDIRRFREIWSDTPPIALTFVPEVFVRFFGEGWLMIPSLAALLYGAWRACRDRRPSQWLILAVIVAVAAISLAGVSHYPHAYARFLIATLPWLLLIIADGLLAVERGRWIAWSTVAVLVLCSLSALATTRQRQHAYPWHRVAQYVRQELTPTAHCVVLGRPVLNTPLQVYDVATSSTLAGVLSTAPSDQPLRLVLVDPGAGVFRDASVRTFGDVRVMVVEGLPTALAERLLTELAGSTAGRIAPELQHVYQQMAELLRWRGRAEDAAQAERLAGECRLRDERTRQRPPQFLHENVSE